MCADDGSRSTFDIPPAHPDRDPLRVIKRADSALHDPGQLNLGEFAAATDGGGDERWCLICDGPTTDLGACEQTLTALREGGDE